MESTAVKLWDPRVTQMGSTQYILYGTVGSKDTLKKIYNKAWFERYLQEHRDEKMRVGN